MYNNQEQIKKREPSEDVKQGKLITFEEELWLKMLIFIVLLSYTRKATYKGGSNRTIIIVFKSEL
jgi:hypothetical protein